MPICVEALLHLPDSQMAYAYTPDLLHFRIRSRKDDLAAATLRIGDPFLWVEGGLDGGNLAGADARGWSGARNLPMSLEYTDELYDYWFVEASPENRRSRYAFILEAREGARVLHGEKRTVTLGTAKESALLQDIGNFFCHPYLHRSEAPDIPDWAKHVIWYQIFPDRFCNGNPELDPPGTLPWGSDDIHSVHAFTGGDIAGIRSKLDYLESLGVTGLYFCPVFSASTNHRYDTIDYFQVDPKLGTNAEFRCLVDEAHARGMRVMMDAVFNHLGQDSPQWQDVVANGRASRYADWFHIHRFPVWPQPPEQLDGRDLNYETFGFVPSMPKLNTAHPACREFLIQVGRFWLEDMDCDAWRLDVANEVDHQFWRDFRREMKAIKPDCYLLGEIWHDAMPWLRGDQFDAVMNYPLTDAIHEFFIHSRTTPNQFISAVNRANGAYPRHVTEAGFNLMDSHDTSRVMGVAKGDLDRVRQAYAFLFANPGSPCLFQGGEFGLDGLRDIDMDAHRACMPWDEPDKQNQQLWKYLHDLIRIRKTEKSLCESDTEWLEATSDGALVLRRGGLLWLLGGSRDETLALPATFHGAYRDLLENRRVRLTGQHHLRQRAVQILKPEPAQDSENSE